MRSDTWTVRQIFQDRRQYCVPFYQRAYVWNQSDQWQPLWQDIKAKAEARLEGGTVTPHFLGAVVVEPQARIGLRGVDTLHIIDGQQRLTTLQYILTALLIAFREKGVQGLDVTLDQCLENGNPDTMVQPQIERYKVWPTFRDRSSHEMTMAARSLQELRNSFAANFTRAGELRRIGVEHPPSLGAIWFFANEFICFVAQASEGKDRAAEALAMAVLQDLKLVLISLEADDDAQVIFETMNGRGATLHATDLIRNFIFMRADRDGSDAQALYDARWSQFESSAWSARERRGRLLKPKLEWLIYTALQAETHVEVDLPRLYADYRAYALNKGKPRTAEAQLLTLDSYAAHYTALTTGQGSMPVARFGRRIAPYETTTIHSLALLISTSLLSDDEKTSMFNALVSYIVRRAVCGLTAKNYNNTFLSMLRHLAKEGTTPEALHEQMRAQTSEISRWPDDAEFKNACKTASLYEGRLDAPKMRQLLTELEGELRNQGRSEEPEIPLLVNLDIDHIMPKAWYEHWPLSDGSSVSSSEANLALLAERNGVPLTDDQARIRARVCALPTLGNLTLLNLSVNREAKHREFQVKRDLLVRNTNLSLNMLVLNNEAWDINEIEARGERLANVAAKLYPGPDAKVAP
jgi:hypothetical protein